MTFRVEFRDSDKMRRCPAPPMIAAVEGAYADRTMDAAECGSADADGSAGVNLTPRLRGTVAEQDCGDVAKAATL